MPQNLTGDRLNGENKKLDLGVTYSAFKSYITILNCFSFLNVQEDEHWLKVCENDNFDLLFYDV